MSAAAWTADQWAEIVWHARNARRAREQAAVFLGAVRAGRGLQCRCSYHRRSLPPSRCPATSRALLARCRYAARASERRLRDLAVTSELAMRRAAP